MVVRTVPELVELAGRNVGEGVTSGSTRRVGRATSIKYQHQKAKTEDQLASEKGLISTDQVWLVHKQGYSLCVLKGHSDVGKVKIKLQSGQVIEVNEYDIEKASPGKFDQLEDISGLRYLNECSLLHTLRHRYYSNLCHTFAGHSLVAINSVHPLSIYSDKIVEYFKARRTEELPPHIFSVAHAVFKAMMATRKDQAIVMMGHQGSGKTFHTHNILNYYLTSSGAVNHVLNPDKLSAVWTLLSSFGGCRSVSGSSASHFTHVFTLDFDQNGQITSASIQAMMLERRRLVGGGTFQIFHQFLSGLEASMRKDLHLDYMDTNHPYLTFTSVADDKRKCQQQWSKIVSSFQQLSFTAHEIKAFCLVLSAIYHLGSARAVKGVSNRAQFEHLPSAEQASSLLGCTVDELHKSIFHHSTTHHHTTMSTLKLPNSMNRDPLLALLSPMEQLEGFLMGLYGELFNSLIALINRSLSSNLRSAASIMVVDSPGFRGACGSNCSSAVNPGCSLEDLFHNYAHERLQNLFHTNVFDNTADLYAQEEVETNFTFPSSPSSLLIKLIDNPPQNLSRSSGNDKLSSNEGLLWMLDGLSLLPSSTDQSFVQEALLEYSTYKYNKQVLISSSPPSSSSSPPPSPSSSSSSPPSFRLLHMNGMRAVQYNVAGWLRSCRDATSVTKSILPLLLDSKRTQISDMFSQTCRSMSAVMGGSVVGATDLHATSSLRRVSSMKRSFASGTAAVKKKSLCLQVKFQMDSLVDMLRRMNVSFIHCMLPFQPSSTHPPSNLPIDTPYLRQQLRAYQILSSARLYKQGYPDNLTYGHFLNRYNIFMQGKAPLPAKKLMVDGILKELDIDPSSYCLGTTKVLFHAGVLGELEVMKEARVSDWLVGVQSVCRRRLAIKKLQKLKIQNVAVMCVQKNVRKLMAIRTWPWWRLYTKVQPLLNVQRTEDELKDREYELEQLRSRVEKVEKERQEYKSMAERLELQVTELCLEAQEQEGTATQASDMLQIETAHRLTLEKQFKEFQSKVSTLESSNRVMEMELMNAKVVNASIVDSDGDDDSDDASIYKERYNRLKRDMEVRMKKMQMANEEELGHLRVNKKATDKKLSDSLIEAERLERLVAEGRKKQQRRDDEVADTKIHLEQHVARNTQLEKKQRKFDAEMSKLGEQLRQEKALKERLAREKEEVTAVKYSLSQQLKDTQGDLEVENTKSHRLEKQIFEAMTADKDDNDSWKSRQARVELEGKVAELEEELDDQAATIQQLQQTKLRLEMGHEKLRQQMAKEVDERENDLEEVKRNFQKKMKTLELQLEEEYEERQSVSREKKEVEKKLQAVVNERPARDKDTEQLLRRDLRRTKALLQDAQLMLNKYQQTAGNRTTLRQLKDQLEDAEFSAAAALKAKKGMELEVNDLQQQIDAVTRLKNESEERYIMLKKENHELMTRVEEGEEEEAELMKKYKTAVQQHSLDLIKFEDQSKQIGLLQGEREQMRDEMDRLRSRTEYFEASTVDKETITRLEAKIRDLEAKVDFEQTTRRRIELQASRLKDQLETESDQRQGKKAAELKNQEELRSALRKFKELQDDVDELRMKESEATKKKFDLERKLEDTKTELDQSHGDLHLAFKRINELTTVMESDMVNDDDDDDLGDEEYDEDDDDEDGYQERMNSFKHKHKLSDGDDGKKDSEA